MTRQKNETHRREGLTERSASLWFRYVCWPALVSLISLTLGLPAIAQRNPKDLLCFPNLSFYSLVNGNKPPVIDGNIAGDPGWNGAFRYVFGTGTPDVNAIVQGIRDSTNTNIYLSIQGNNLENWDHYTYVILAFDPSPPTAPGSLAQQVLLIQPIPAGAGAAPTAPSEIQYLQGSAITASQPTPTYTKQTPWPTPANIMTGYADGGSYQWYMEAQLPIDPSGMNGVNIPTSGQFGLYIDVIRIIDNPVSEAPGTGPGAESTWPPDASGLNCAGAAGTACEPAAAIPSPATWGNGTIDPTVGCQGVSITSQVGNIYTNNGLFNAPGYGLEPGISLTGSNIFSAYVQNTSIDTTGAPVAAQGVIASFKIANFGMPSNYGSWAIPGSEPGGSPIIGENPSTSPQNISASPTCGTSTNNNSPLCTISTGAWTLNAQEQAAYNTPATTHQCVQVTLDQAPGTGTNAIFLNNTATQNMNFATASTMERVAEISAKGYPLPAGMTDQLFDIGVTTKSETLNSTSTVRGTNAGQISQLTWEAQGCRHLNNFILIGEKKIELCQNVGGFGFFVQHPSSVPVKQWTQGITGQNLVKVKNNVYTIHIPQNGVAQVTTKISPIESSIVVICGTNISSSAAIVLLIGLILVGLVVYRLLKGKW